MPLSPLRRQLTLGSLLGLTAPWPALAATAPQAETGNETRMALLLGNRNYPQPFDLPPIPKNLRDLHAALLRRGFRVTDALDQDLPASRAAMARFIEEARQAPPDATLFFYFSGHGVQVDSANLLLPAGIDPSAKSDVLRKGSLQLLSDVVGRLPERREGMTIAVVDACRTGLKSGEITGLNQVEAPPGCLIAFSTAAGKPAVAPAVETQNTFYTGSLVRLLDSVPDETSFSDLMSLVKSDVRSTMLNHPVQAIRQLAQDPFIADHSRVRLAVAPRQTRKPAEQRFGDSSEESDWQRLEQCLWPAEVVQAAEGFMQRHPGSALVLSATVARDGARLALKALQRSDVRLYRTAFSLGDNPSTDLRQDLGRAARGDKDAAARMAGRYRAQTGASAALSRYEGWLQFAVALGNGIASYELALHYRNQGQPLLASQFEARALDLGYTPPPDLDNVRK